MKTIIIYRSNNDTNGGLYEDVTMNDLLNVCEIEKDNILFYIPLEITGKTYQEKKNNLRELAIDYQRTYYEFCNYSYGELIEISNFFETTGKRYGLITEFKNEGII